MKIRYNAPVVLSFSLLCFGIFVLCVFLPPLRGLFLVPGGSGFSFSQPVNAFRLFSHALGHASWDHLFGNLAFILLLGPILEEKHGSGRLLMMIVLTALATGLMNALLFSTALMGASGVVFMMILLVSITNIRAGEIPLSFILVALIYVTRELLMGLADDQIAHSAHLVGGACGALFGFAASPARARGSR